MTRRILLSLVSCAVLAALGCSLSSSKNDNNKNNNPGDITAVNHIVFMLEENRSFDHYFGHLNDYRASIGLPQDVDGTPANASNPCRPGDACGFDGSTTLTAYRLNTQCVENPSPSWQEAHVQWSKDHPTQAPATMDGFVSTAGGDAIIQGFNDTMGRRAMGYYTSEDLPYYYNMASQFATSDRWFAPAMTDTPPNRAYSMAATSQGRTRPSVAGSGTITAKTIFQALDENNISWKIYDANSYSYFFQFSYSVGRHNKVVPLDQYFSDLASGNLPQVAMIEPPLGLDEHPGTTPGVPGQQIEAGAANVKRIIDALMTSSAWPSSVFILSFDEHGGFYDHVPPFAEPNPDGIAPNDLPPGNICNQGETNTVNCDFNTSGFRVPLLVVSPFTKPHYVSHTNADYTAILKFIETRFKLSALTQRDAAQPDMTEFFDFTNAPNLKFGTPPPQPNTKACYFTTLP